MFRLFFSRTQAVVVGFLAALAFIPARADYGIAAEKAFAEIHEVALRCVVRPVVYSSNGKKTLLAPQSICPEVQQDSSASVTILMNGYAYRAVIQPSIYADNGDLANLYLYDHRGQIIAQRNNIPAFGNVLYTLIGSRERFAEQTVIGQ